MEENTKKVKEEMQADLSEILPANTKIQEFIKPINSKIFFK